MAVWPGWAVELDGVAPVAVAVAVPPSAEACAEVAPPRLVPRAEEVAEVAPVELVPVAVALAPPTALAPAAEVPGPAVFASPALVPTPRPKPCVLAPALVSLEPLCAAPDVPTELPFELAAEEPPPVVLAPVSFEPEPASLCELASEPPPLACEEADPLEAAALDSAFESVPVEPAPAPSPPAFVADLPAPAAAVLDPVPPYALAPAPVLPSPSLTPADAGAPLELLPYAPATPTAPVVDPLLLLVAPTVPLLWPRALLLSLPYALDRAPPFALVGSASEVPVRWMTPRAEIPAMIAALRAARIAAVGLLCRGPRWGGAEPGWFADSSSDIWVLSLCLASPADGRRVVDAAARGRARRRTMKIDDTRHASDDARPALRHGPLKAQRYFGAPSQVRPAN